VPDFCMPALGSDMEAGTLLEWRIAPGQAVRRGDIVAVVDTDKAEIEVEIFTDGIVEELLVAPGTKVPVGTVLARLRTAGEAKAPAPPEAFVPDTAPRPRISPLARRIAAEQRIDLATIRGTGAGGAITRADVALAAAERSRSGAPPPKTTIQPAAASREAREPSAAERTSTPTPLGVRDISPALAAAESDRAPAMRRTIAAAMTRSKREIPHYYLATRIDMGQAVRWLDAENLRHPVTERLLPSALLLKATALALRKVPELNGFFRDAGFIRSDAIHLGVAISLRGGGLIAPALHDADRRSLGDLMATLRDLVQRARAGVLRSSELSDATITVTNLGDLGVETVFGVIYPPQVALVGFGRLREEPWAENGMVGAKPVVTATLAADHRASDGHRGGLFLSVLDRLVQSPEKL
jgi:pyruvate dehydrogenase E2 component (dihydrolipoyllysine-residue acetyltransferase)